MNNITINFNTTGPIISKYIYGHFAEHLGRCIYDGFYVGKNSDIPNINGIRNDVIAALNNIKIPVLRWPGGCFADEYHWQDGVGPKEKRKKSINTHWGMVTETNQFGTHEFFNLCQLLNCDAYVAGNLGSGTAIEMQNWVDYISCEKESTMADLRINNGQITPWKLPFFGIGNESWGCGGHMTPQYYSDLYKQYQTYVRNYAKNSIKKIACGPNNGDYKWTETLMKNASSLMWGLSLHHYTTTFNNFKQMGSAKDFKIDEWNTIIRNSYLMDEYITKHSEIMDKYDKERKVALVVDEWGTWYKTEPGTNKHFLYQQNTIRDAVSASIQLNIFNKHCDRVKMANIAQTVNVLQALILTDEDIMIKTPTYHVFDLYKHHQENILLPLYEHVETINNIQKLSSTSSYDKKNNIIYFSVSNSDPINSTTLNLRIDNITQIKNIIGHILTGNKITSHNTKENVNNVSIKDYTNYSYKEKEIILQLPPRSILTIQINI